MAGIWTQLANFQGIIGVMVGLGASPTIDALKTRRNERRAVDSKTAELALEILAKLRRLEKMPGEEDEVRMRASGDFKELSEEVQTRRKAWVRLRMELVDEFHTASGRFSGSVVRERLAVVHTVLGRGDDLWYEANVEESWSRRVACDFGVDCLNAVLRRGKMPEIAKPISNFLDDIAFADEMRAEIERSRIAHQRQRRLEREREARQEEENPASE